MGWWRRASPVIGHAAMFLLLTALTEIGGLVWLILLVVRRRFRIERLPTFILIFVILYSGAVFGVRHVAPLLGREPLPCLGSEPLRVLSPLTCALNRNYATPELHRAAETLARHMESTFPGTMTSVLDAGFPFLDGVPLLPHLSHDDGRKLDIAFYYEDRNGDFQNGAARSPIGYFAFEQPFQGAPLPCSGKPRLLSLRWDLDWLQPIFADWRIEPARTREALRWLSNEGRQFGVEKVFVEPHVSARLGGSNDWIRFQGCRAARHDDHIHFQVK